MLIDLMNLIILGKVIVLYAAKHLLIRGRDLKRILDPDDNLPSFTLYAIRHSYARRLIKNLPSAAVLSMGNDVRIFTETYLDAINRQDMAAIQKNL